MDQIVGVTLSGSFLLCGAALVLVGHALRYWREEGVFIERSRPKGWAERVLDKQKDEEPPKEKEEAEEKVIEL